jgi:enoyl-[acyl-carrier protein] reductase I
MGFLDGKRILITGLLSTRSIAWGIARAARREGAELALTYQNERVRDRVSDMAKELGCDLLLPCDVSSDDEITGLAAAVGERWDGLDGFVHAIAYVPKEALSGDLLEGFSRDAFRIAHEVSAYSFPALAKVFAPMMLGRRGALVTLSYIGAVRAMPHYNTMGLAKASLEASVRYLAAGLGPKGIRVNGISAGPIKTLAASGIAEFRRIFKHVEEASMIRRNVTIEDVGNTAAFLLSDLAAGITGEVIYVDGGYRHSVPGLQEEED